MIVGMSETMEKFTLKISKELRCYELDEEKRMLHITVQKRRCSNTAEKIRKTGNGEDKDFTLAK